MVRHILFGIYIWSINEPRRSLAPALLSAHIVENLWLYWTATFNGTSAIIDDKLRALTGLQEAKNWIRTLKQIDSGWN